MVIRKILIGILVTLALVFLGMQAFDLEIEAAGIRALLLVLLTTLYCYKVKRKRLFFLTFLAIFTIAEILNFIGWHVPAVASNNIDYLYYIINSLYIVSYLFLILEILTSMNLVEMIKKYPFHTLTLIILDVFSVVVVTNTAIQKLSPNEYYVEFIYNAIIMILLTFSLLNYIDKNDKKSVNLLIGSIFIFFSEVLQLAYFYISDIILLNVICSLFLVLAFLFFYLQSKTTYQLQETRYTITS